MTTNTLDKPSATTRPKLMAKSPFHLSPEQIQAFDDNGYLILRQRVIGPLLAALQAAGTEWIAQARASENTGLAGDVRDGKAIHSDFVFATRKSGARVPFRVNYIHNKGNAASLETLGSPQILGIVESLAGKNFVPTYESMVFKSPGDGEIIPWHQDAVFAERKFRIFNIDIYLDTAKKDTGALRVIPRSQLAIHDVCPMNDGTYDWENGSHEIVEMEPGDVLIHDDMVLHGSPYTAHNPLRRVVYYEFRPVEQIVEEGPWDRSFIDQRMLLVPMALKRFQDAYPAHPQFQWSADAEFRPTDMDDEEAALHVVHTTHTGGSYCSANSK